MVPLSSSDEEEERPQQVARGISQAAQSSSAIASNWIGQHGMCFKLHTCQSSCCATSPGQ